MKISFFKPKHTSGAKALSKSSQKAFTLVEMMVSVTIFLIVMVIALGAILAIIDGNKKVQSINSVSNNLNAAIESMVRDIKTGYKYKCGARTMPINGNEVSNCNPAYPSNTLSFISTISNDPRPVQYNHVVVNGRGMIQKVFCPATVVNPAVSCAIFGNYQTLGLTSSDIDIKRMEFYAMTPTAGAAQPGVFILIQGTAYTNKTQTSDFSIQTFVSQRLLNI